jgi:hypothetical protein
MKPSLLKNIASGAAVFGLALSAYAGPTPSGLAPTLASLSDVPGLNPAGPQYPFPNGGSPVAIGQELIAQGGPVYVTDLGPTGASFDEQIFVASPNDGFNNLFMDNHSTANGTTYYLGTFAPGTEVEIGLDILNSGGALPPNQIWYTGPGSRNPNGPDPGSVRAYMVSDYEGLGDTTYVGFEDYQDFNYVDEVFAFTGTKSVMVPDMASTLPLLGLGLGGLAAVGRRFRK